MAELGDTLTTLFAQNQAWSEVMKEVDSRFFDQLSSSHKPKCFWIGCSDARVSHNQITDSNLGELFIYRNIGNHVMATETAFNYALESKITSHNFGSFSSSGSLSKVFHVSTHF